MRTLIIPSYRILVVIPSASLGGISTGLLGLLLHLNRSRYRVSVATLQSGPAVQLFRKQRIQCHILPVENRLTHLRSVIVRERIQLIQSCDSASEGALAAKRLGLPHVWYLGSHIDLAFKAPSKKSLKNLRLMIGSLSDAVIVQSYALARDLFPRLSKKKLHVIPWGIEKTTVRKASFSSNLLRIGMVANFYPAKRHLDFLKAASIIHKKIQNARFIIAGNVLKNRESISYQRKIKEAIHRSGLQKVAKLTHFSPFARNQFYGALNLLVVPSYEGMSQAVLEAAVIGVPVVAANVGGAKEVVRHQKSGLLVPYRRPRKIAEAVIHILQNPKFAKNLGRKLRQSVLLSFRADRQARKFERLYKSILSAPTERN